jgi:hypothetical protein
MLAKVSPEINENENRWLILKTKVFEENLKTAFRLFRQSGIEPVLIKGWAAALEYPEKHLRAFSDMDLCVAPDMYERSLALAAGEEFRKLVIDLHCGLRHLDTLGWDDLFENSRLISLEGVDVRILRPEDHLRVLCVHWLNDGGANKEKLLDIFYLLENHSNDFDWERCLGKISPTRRGWIKSTIKAAHIYLGMDISGLPFVSEDERLPDWFVKALEREWASGTKLLPIHTLLGRRGDFWRQFKKRFPPNAIQATIDMEGTIDDSTRFFYQLGSILLRMKPSLKRMLDSMKIYRKRGFK